MLPYLLNQNSSLFCWPTYSLTTSTVFCMRNAKALCRNQHKLKTKFIMN